MYLTMVKRIAEKFSLPYLGSGVQINPNERDGGVYYSPYDIINLGHSSTEPQLAHELVHLNLYYGLLELMGYDTKRIKKIKKNVRRDLRNYARKVDREVKEEHDVKIYYHNIPLNPEKYFVVPGRCYHGKIKMCKKSLLGKLRSYFQKPEECNLLEKVRVLVTGGIEPDIVNLYITPEIVASIDFGREERDYLMAICDHEPETKVVENYFTTFEKLAVDGSLGYTEAAAHLLQLYLESPNILSEPEKAKRELAKRIGRSLPPWKREPAEEFAEKIMERFSSEKGDIQEKVKECISPQTVFELFISRE
ncbi:MAG: hypothetical protein GXO63_02165 [Candidatus Micrarchaeota archaeon]|nr:hypothetical protein [Candidatus Micrarchaeota archaeon]